MYPRHIPIASAWLAAAAIAIVTQAARASDAWIVTDQDLVAEDQPVWLSLVAGDAFPFSAAHLDPDAITRCTDTVAGLQAPLVGLRQQDGAFSRRRPITGASFHIFAASLPPEFVEHAAPESQPIQETEEMKNEARQSGESANTRTVIIERRLRFAKTIVGLLPLPDSDRTFAQPVGLLFEIIPLSRPTDARPGENLDICVTLDGHPWPDVTVSARCTAWSGDQPTLETQTDDDGFASFTPESAGHWCITAQLTRAATGIDRVDRETLCSTLSFRVTGECDANRALQIVRAGTGTLNPEGLLGYRMGQCAVHSFGMPANSRALAVTHQSPEHAPADGIPQGIRLAVRPDGGDVSLWQEAAPDQGMMTVFNSRLEDRQLVIQVLPNVLQWLREMSPEEAESASLRLASMRDDELFTATLLQPPPAAPATIPWHDTPETVAVDVGSGR